MRNTVNPIMILNQLAGWPVELSEDTNCIKLWENIQ